MAVFSIIQGRQCGYHSELGHIIFGIFVSCMHTTHNQNNKEEEPCHGPFMQVGNYHLNSQENNLYNFWSFLNTISFGNITAERKQPQQFYISVFMLVGFFYPKALEISRRRQFLYIYYVIWSICWKRGGVDDRAIIGATFYICNSSRKLFMSLAPCWLQPC